jgi:hypothetical protein
MNYVNTNSYLKMRHRIMLCLAVSLPSRFVVAVHATAQHGDICDLYLSLGSSRKRSDEVQGGTPKFLVSNNLRRLQLVGIQRRAIYGPRCSVIYKVSRKSPIGDSRGSQLEISRRVQNDRRRFFQDIQADIR